VRGQPPPSPPASGRRPRQGWTGRHLRAFFACIYYSALRPGEVTALTRTAVTLPTGDGWGRFCLTQNSPATTSRWTDDGRRQPRQLKHRAVGATRTVPIPPPLVAILREHLEEFGTHHGGRLFWGSRHGGLVSDSVYDRTWDKARQAPPSPLPRPPHRSPGSPTTYATPRYPPGSAPASNHPRSPNGPVTPSTSCSASTPNASTAAKRSTSNASRTCSACH
jgi:integrase